MKKWLLALAAAVSLAGTARAQIPEAVLDSLQYTAFRYFWDEANPANGLVKDRSTPGSVCSIASTGFGLSAICVAVDHGWITREQARTRVLATLQTFWNGPQGPSSSGVMGYKGLYYHWLDMNSGLRRVDWDAELSTIDTALLFAGILHARQFFASDDPADVQIRALADSITWRADWNWARNGTDGLAMEWKPASGFNGKWVGYNEAMIMYILALGSPTHPVPPSDWDFWTSGYTWGPYGSVPAYVKFPPLFGHQYSHCWIDFRGIQDAYMRTKGITYFENSRRATLAQISFARFNGIIAQMFPGNFAVQFGESDSLWGFTASDDPNGYAAHGSPGGFHNGTITPTAPISSIPFCPDSVWPCIRNLYTNHRGAPQWGRYGFTDAFNPVQLPWLGLDYLGIDQGPIVLMIENHRTQMVWARFMQNADVQRGLQAAGFTPVAVSVEPPAGPGARDELFAASPNPFHDSTLMRFRLAKPARVRLQVFDLQGRGVATLVDDERMAGEHTVTFVGTGLPPGVYHYRLDVNGASFRRKAVLIP